MQKRSVVLMIAVGILAVLAACGGGSSTPAAPAPPPPTPTPAPNYSGTYTSNSMIFNLAGLAELRGTGRTTVTQNGNSLDFSRLEISNTVIGSTSYQLGNATLTGQTFTGASAYNSVGCDVINVTWDGRFAGNLMNLHVTLTPTSRGERVSDEVRVARGAIAVSGDGEGRERGTSHPRRRQDGQGN
jgi:hypothetical protein